MVSNICISNICMGNNNKLDEDSKESFVGYLSN
jgi:hypothetical protein